jgi:ATP-dependent RNA helicase SUPV3L1/SUV3
MTTSPKSHDIQKLDTLTDGAFSAATSGERATRIRAWLSQDPNLEQLQEVFRELGARDKGAARPVRERLDEIRRAKAQEQMAAEWAAKAQELLGQAELNIADALAWQRDAAKAGAPLSKEPLVTLKASLAERVRVIEDLQHTVQVQREAAVLLAQRIEVLSTKPWSAAQAVWGALREDVAHWQQQASVLEVDANWGSVDMKFPPLLEASRGQLLAVWDAFQTALAQAVAAAGDAQAPLPPVQVWADELRAARGLPAQGQVRPAKVQVDPQVRQQATDLVSKVLATLESEMAQGHGKASAGAAAALRNALKEHARTIDDALENRAHAALAAASELEGWQRWRADQLRQELVAKAEGLLARPPGQAIGGRKMQETLRHLREQWKQTDQGGAPNHGLWKRFDEACNNAHKVVEGWIEKVKADAVLHRTQRLALIEEVTGWAAANTTALDDDWRGFARILHQFRDRWRDAGHVGEKGFAELQPLWHAAITQAAAPLDALQQGSVLRRQAMIEEAAALGAAPMLRVDAVKALQQRWQAEAQTVPMDRRHEQKLWDAFRKPIDQAFERKTAQRQEQESALGEHDRVVLEASKALEAANSSGDAQRIRSAMAGLEAALRGQALARDAVTKSADQADNAAVAVAASDAGQPAQGGDTPNASSPADASQARVDSDADAPTDAAVPPPSQDMAPDNAEPAPDAPAEVPEASPAAAPAPVKPPARPVVAVRGDDRPGMRPSSDAGSGAARGGRFGDRKDAGRGGPGAGRGDRPGAPRGGDRGDGRLGGPRESRYGERDDRPQTPRLGDTAFRAQRDAMEHAQFALRKLASQAHGEALSHLLGAWQARDPQQLPPAQELGPKVGSAVRSGWLQALGATPGTVPDAALLRLEMAAEVPTPAEHLDARRMFQLQLLTRRNDPPPAQTWAQDVGQVLQGGFEPGAERRLRAALKVLLKP